MRNPKCKIRTERRGTLAIARSVCILHVALCIPFLGAACASKVLSLPSPGGAPLPNAAQLHADATKTCAAVRTLTAELGLSGRAGAQRISGRAVVGFESPDAMRLEGVAPIGQPGFILVSRGGDATLLLPRDDRVLTGANAGDILGALTGVALAPEDLKAILTGCVAPAAAVASGTERDGWVILVLEGGSTVYLRRTDGTALELRAARRDNWQIEYAEWQNGLPRIVRIVSSAAPPVDMTARLSQIEINIDLEDRAFSVDVPGDALPITLDELRNAGPLRGSSSSDEPRSRRDTEASDIGSSASSCLPVPCQ
jgi:outer membrane biogenesis lipoprotein LolB